jgi:hypothetical protein
MTTVADIDARIYQLRRDLSQARMDRARAVARERASERQAQVQKAVVDAFDAGQEIAQGPTGMWWHESGKLIRRATADELQAADELALAGVLVRETRRAT